MERPRDRGPVRVLAEFWRIYRTRPDYDPAVGLAVLEQAARYGDFLASPRHLHVLHQPRRDAEFLGLLQLTLAFPTLPEAAMYRQTALERLDRQMPFYIDARGVIRENSAGYQAYGLEMLGMTFRCMTLLGDPVPEIWAQRYTAGLRFLDGLRRPDGTLPANGDTDGASTGDFPRVTKSMRRDQLQAAPLRGSTPDRALTLHASAGIGSTGKAWTAGPRVAGNGRDGRTWTSPPLGRTSTPTR